MRTIRRLALVAVLVSAAFYFWPAKPAPLLPILQVKSLDIEIRKLDGNEFRWKSSSSTDVVRIQTLLQVMQTAKGTSDHKCGDSGRLSFQLESGPPLKIGILAGHDADYYEYRVYQANERGYDIFKVDRAEFLQAMNDLGQLDLDLGAPE